MVWETVIGLEVHAQLKTFSKIFSGAPITFGADPNTQACAIDLGLPGILPVLNEKVVTLAIRFGLSVQADIEKRPVFARKNYFYPDLPKGYQISQLDKPIVKNGHLDILLEDNSFKRIGITRAHLEEDAGKSLHEEFNDMTGIDLNRAGTPLLEIVSEPDLRSAKEAVAYLKALHTLVRYLDICDGNMQEGSFRCDANVSVRPAGSLLFGTRIEIKNLNSFRFIEKAIDYEVARQISVLESGGKIIQETRLYDSIKNETRSMRSKEEAQDYRYFPDPDLLPVEITDVMIETVKRALPELPQEKRERFMRDYQLSAYDADILIDQPDMAQYVEAVIAQTQGQAKLAANWVMGDLSAALNKYQINIVDSPVSAAQLGTLINRIQDKTISGKIAKDIFSAVWAGEGEVDDLILKKGLTQITDTAHIEKMVDAILATYPKEVEEYRAGKEKLFGFFVGQVMKMSGGKIDPQQLNQLLALKLKQ